MPEPVVFSKMGERSDGLLPKGCLRQGRRKSERHAHKEEDVGLETTATLRLAEETLWPGGPELKLLQLGNCGNSERGGANRLARRLVQYFEEHPMFSSRKGKLANRASFWERIPTRGRRKRAGRTYPGNPDGHHHRHLRHLAAGLSGAKLPEELPPR